MASTTVVRLRHAIARLVLYTTALPMVLSREDIETRITCAGEPLVLEIALYLVEGCRFFRENEK